MTKFVVPALSADGWVQSSKERADYLLSHFYLSDYSQTHLYTGNVSSLSYLMTTYGHDKYLLQTNLQRTLQDYFVRYNFKNVIVDITVEEESPDSNKQMLKIYMGFTDEDGQDITMENVLSIINGKFAKVVDKVTYGWV